MTVLPRILYENRLLDGTPTATDTDATGDFSVNHLTDLRTYTFWKAASYGTKYITIDCGSAKSADSFGIISHNLATASATVSLESSATGAWAGEETARVAGFVPAADTAIFKTFATASARYWRVKIVTASVAPYIGVCMFGGALEFPVYPEAPFTPESEGIVAEIASGKEGNLLGATIRHFPISCKASFDSPPLSFVDGAFATFWQTHGRMLKPFFWVPNLADFPGVIRFVRFPDGFKLATPRSNMTYADSLDLNFEGVAE